MFSLPDFGRLNVSPDMLWIEYLGGKKYRGVTQRRPQADLLEIQDNWLLISRGKCATKVRNVSLQGLPLCDEPGWHGSVGHYSCPSSWQALWPRLGLRMPGWPP